MSDASFLSSAGGSQEPPPLLLAVPDEALPWLWRGWVAALEPTLARWSQTPTGAPHPLPPRIVEQLNVSYRAGVLPGQEARDLLRLLIRDLLVGQEILEAFLLDGRDEGWYPILAACCTRIGQVYRELKRRGGLLYALGLLRGALKHLGYLSTPAIADLLRERASDG